MVVVIFRDDTDNSRGSPFCFGNNWKHFMPFCFQKNTKNDADITCYHVSDRDDVFWTSLSHDRFSVCIFWRYRTTGTNSTIARSYPICVSFYWCEYLVTTYLMEREKSMNPDIIVPVVTVIISAIVSILGTWAMFYNQKSRNKSQNFHDDMDTAKNALEIAERATAKNLELEKRIEALTNILKDKHYKVTVIFSLGETPRIESASIEAVPAHTRIQ